MSAEFDNAFTFTSQGLPAETFTVVRFEGEEALSTLYRFDILLVSERGDLDLETLIDNSATLTIAERFAGGEALPIHGTLAHVEQLHAVDRHYFYRAELRPRLWWLTQRHYSQVFLDLNLMQCIDQVLQEGGLRPGLDYAYRRPGDVYPTWEYICQYNESHFAFFSRWLEWGGGYYWFEQAAAGDKLLMTDNLMAHGPLPGSASLRYSPVAGLETEAAGRAVHSFNLRQRSVVRNVRVKDYNYQKPAIDLAARATVQEEGRGEFYQFSEGFWAMAGADTQARLRTEEMSCRQRIFYGESVAPTLRPGYTFALQGHFKDGFNRDYLTTRVQHVGSQARFLQSGLGLRGLEDGDALFYRNSFQCIPATTQFRAARETPWPRIYGTISARVDAAGSGKYADIDAQGRYKVIMPFDLSGREAGHASAWLRMATPYAGDGHGMHFPLHKGTEVLVTFVDGNPDRPTILSAVPNPQTASVVTAANQTCNRIETAAGHQLVMDDLAGKESVGLYSSDGAGGKGSWVWMGKNSPQSMELVSSGNTNTLTNGMYNQIVLGAQNNVTLGSNATGTLGTNTTVNLGAISTANVGGSLAFSYGHALEFGGLKKTVQETQEILATDRVTIRGGVGPVLREDISTARAKAWAGAAGFMTLLSSASGLAANGMFEEISKVGASDDNPGDPKVGWTAAAIGIAAALAQWILIVKAMKQLVETLEEARSSITLDDNGIELKTGPAAMHGTTINTETRIVLQRQESFLDQEAVRARLGASGGRVAVDQVGLVLGKYAEDICNGGKVSVNAEGVQIARFNGQQRDGGEIIVSNGAACLNSPNNKVGLAVTDEGVKIKSGENIATLRVNSNGVIDLN